MISAIRCLTCSAVLGVHSRSFVFRRSAKASIGILISCRYGRSLTYHCRRRSYAELATVVTPASILPTILADPDDDYVLACALAAQADLIVSGDAHLLNLKTYHRIRIVSATEALALIAKP